MKSHNYSKRFWIIVVGFFLAGFLSWNRFSLQAVYDNVTYNFPLRNYLEHLTWGFMWPILCVALSLGFDVLAKRKLSWFPGYICSAAIFVAGALTYYAGRWYVNGFSSLDCFKIGIDLIGFAFGTWFVMSGRSKGP